MQRIAGMTVIVKADGVPEALYNGQRDRVVEAIRKEKGQAEADLAVERDRADIWMHRCNSMLKEKLDALAAHVNRPRNPIRSVLDGIELTWAYIYAFTIGEVWLDILETLKLIEKSEEE